MQNHQGNFFAGFIPINQKQKKNLCCKYGFAKTAYEYYGKVKIFKQCLEMHQDRDGNCIFCEAPKCIILVEL